MGVVPAATAAGEVDESGSEAVAIAAMAAMGERVMASSATASCDDAGGGCDAMGDVV